MRFSASTPVRVRSIGKKRKNNEAKRKDTPLMGPLGITERQMICPQCLHTLSLELWL
jgi:hypothetical protein